MERRMQGDIALVSGGGSGIGKAVAVRFAHAGAIVVVAGRRPDVLDSTVREIEQNGGVALAVPTNVTNSAEVERLIGVIRQKYGRINTLVNAAGVLRVGHIHEMDEEDFDLTFQTNVKGLWLLSKAAVPLMKDQPNSNIIHFSSTTGTQIQMSLGVYEASKAAVNTLTKVMSKELAEFHIRVNAIAPGPVDTELYRGSVYGDDMEDIPDRRQELASTFPFGRFGTADEVARLALFLALPESDFMSGSITAIDGAMGA